MIYSIGYGNRSFEEFINLIQENDIQFVLDVRSKPYSKFNPDFTKERLEELISPFKIKYAFWGDELGGRPSDSSCYVDGKVDYHLVEQKDFYKHGIERLINAHEHGYKVALMCSESKPEDCHRTKLIGETLFQNDISVKHINEKGTVIDHVDIISKINKGLNSRNLFGELELTSRKRYQ